MTDLLYKFEIYIFLFLTGSWVGQHAVTFILNKMKKILFMIKPILTIL